MNLQRMRQLAGIKLTEGVAPAPGMNSGAEARMQTAGTVGRDNAYAEFDTAQSNLDEKAPPGMEDMVMKLKKEYPGHPEKAFATAWAVYDKNHGKTEEAMDDMEESAFGQDESRGQEPAQEEHSEEVQQALADFENMVMNLYMEPEAAYARITHNLDDAAIAEFNTALEAHGQADYDAATRDDFADEQEFDEAFDLNNGYDDINDANGNDYFPNGADGPVVKSTGVSGARQGDNPEQKRMQVAEVHKELVYGYRNYLAESSAPKKKLNENQQFASDIKLKDTFASPEAEGDTINFDGPVEVSATVLDKNSKPVQVTYLVNVIATAAVEWETDGEPSGWNHRTDSVVYSKNTSATSTMPEVSSVKFTHDDWTIDGQSSPSTDATRHIHPQSLRQLLNGATYEKMLDPVFRKSAMNIEPEVPEYDEPDRDYGW